MSDTCPVCGENYASERAVLTHRQHQHPDSFPWRDEELLRELYYDKEMSLNDISDELGCSCTAVRKSMKRFGLERRSREEGIRLESRRRPALFHTNRRGYEVWSANNLDDRKHIYHHQLLSIAKGNDPSDVFGGGVVHHKINIPWLNVDWNIELLESHSEHREVHVKADARDAKRDAEREPREEHER